MRVDHRPDRSGERGIPPWRIRVCLIGIALFAVIQKRIDQKLKERHKTTPTEWIFPSLLKVGQPVAPSAAYHRLKEILKAAGLPDIRFHDLRHTFATHALTGGVDPKTLSGILGHTNASFTLDTYTHVTTDMQQRASEVVGGFIGDLLSEVQ